MFGLTPAERTLITQYRKWLKAECGCVAHTNLQGKDGERRHLDSKYYTNRDCPNRHVYTGDQPQ